MEHFQLLLLQKALSPFFVVLFEMVKDVVYLLLYHASYHYVEIL